MSSLWRRRQRGRGQKAGKKEPEQEETKLTIPTHFRCPISLELMKDPVSLATGITYDREFIEKWLDSGNVTCPVTKQVLRNFDQIPNHSLRKMIQCWCVENKSFGVERIPTPRIPVTPHDVSEVRSKMGAAARGGDDGSCLELVVKVKNWAKESERNKRCLITNGISTTLADIFEFFSLEKNANLLEEIISALTLTFPLTSDCVLKMKSSLSLRRIAYFLKCDDVSTRRNAILLLKELIISDDQGFVTDGLMQEEEIQEAIFHMVKLPICPKSTQACLLLMHHVISKHAIIASRFIEMGLVSSLLDIIVDGNKNISEKALCVMDDVCNLEEGKRSACGNALTVPILVKKILRVSNAATELCVSILWKMCVGGNEEGAIRALQFGGFQKVLVVLQVGCEEGTKEKATELLRLMNGYRDKVECFDSSMGFKHVKRSI